jgi:hypothetical protein
MSLRDKLNEDLRTAMKAGEKTRVGAIRMAIAAMKEKDVEPGRTGKATDDEILGLLNKLIKQRQESVEIYGKAGRVELAAAEQAEIAVLSAYLPKQMDEAAVSEAISAIVAETGAQSVKDMGRVMAALKAKYAGQMDFGRANGLVKQKLGG